MKSSLHCLIPLLPLLSTQFNSSIPKITSRQAGVSKLLTLCCSIEFFFITTLHGLHGKHRLFSRTALGVFIAPLPSNGRDADHTENNRSIVEACLPRAYIYRLVA
jgi:hypothetical protein